jgi:predicted TIM-barrel fold metal-dependent hydrolase
MTVSIDRVRGLSVVDAHIHQWDPFTSPRVISGAAKALRAAPFLRPLVYAAFPRRDREFIGDPRYVLTRYEVADYQADAAPLHVEAVVHIEAGWHGRGLLGPVDETRWIAGLPFGVGTAPALGAIIVGADLAEPRVGELLDAHLAASPLVRGVRQMGAFHADTGVRSWTKRPGLYADAAFRRGFVELARRGLSFELWCYAEQLPEARALAEAFPETTFVLDHYGTPVGAFGPRGRSTGASTKARHDLLARWREDVAALASCPNVVAKHSGLGMPLLGLAGEGPGAPPSFARVRDAVAPLVSHLQASFGAERTLWASNFPIDKPTLALPESLAIVLDVLGLEGPGEVDRLVRGNARRVYRLAER